jgi:hypothetical protein
VTLEALSRYLLRERDRPSLSAAELHRREVALAELQDLIFVNDTRAYLEHSVRARLGLAFIKEHWAEIMAEAQEAIEKKIGRGSSEGS